MNKPKKLDAVNQGRQSPSKSGVPGSNPGEPTKIIGESAQAGSPPRLESEGRATLNAGKLLAGVDGATPQTAATGKDSLQVQAARLREMAECEVGSAMVNRRAARECLDDSYIQSAMQHGKDAAAHELNAAALLAGADAIQALVQILDLDCDCPCGGREGHTGWCAKSITQAVLDKLEAEHG